jgi:hypothetical protein
MHYKLKYYKLVAKSIIMDSKNSVAQVLHFYQFAQDLAYRYFSALWMGVGVGVGVGVGQSAKRMKWQSLFLMLPALPKGRKPY